MFLEHKIPPLVVAAIAGTIMWGVSRIVPAGSFPTPNRIFLCAVAAIVGIVIMTIAILSFRTAQTTVNPLQPESAEQLVTGGIFKISRNPMYVGLALILLSLAAYLQNLVALLAVPLFMIYMTFFQIRPEERALSEKFGEEFQAYKDSVRRWL
jgi:protein-S-isoprenylcysteine O-methyltransferase Ste14